MPKRIDSDKQGINMIIPEEDSGLIARTSIAFAVDNVLTTEKLSAAVSVLNANLNRDNEIRLCADKLIKDAGGDVTVNIYEECKVDGTNARYCLVATLVVDKVTGAASFRSFNLSGIGYGTGNIKIGAKFAATAVAWVTATAYVVGNIVLSGGSRYRCILDHNSAAADEPGVGANWATYWVLDTVSLYFALYRK